MSDQTMAAPTTSFMNRSPVTQVIVLLTVAVVALVTVSTFEQWLKPHARHALTRDRLEDAQQALDVMRQRLRDVRATLSDTNPRTAVWINFSDAEIARYRQLAIAERNDLERRSLELSLRETRLKDTVAKQSRSWADPLADDSMTDGTFAHTIYNVGSLALILLGYLSLGTAIVVVLGSFVGITLASVGGFLERLVSSSRAGALVAGLAGGTVLAAGTGLLPDVTAPSDAGPLQPGDPPRDGPRDPASNPSRSSFTYSPSYTWSATPVSVLTPVDVTVLGPPSTIDVNTPAVDTREIVEALRAIARIKPEIVVQQDPELTTALARLREDVTTIIQLNDTRFIADITTRTDVIQTNTRDIRTNLEQITNRLDVMKTLHSDNEKLLAALEADTSSSNKLQPLVRAAAANTGCEVEWERSLQQRNGFKRFGHLLVGVRKAPCKPDVAVPLNVAELSVTTVNAEAAK
jgi:hypothetical protein